MIYPHPSEQQFLVSSYPDTFAKVPNQVLSIFKVFEIVQSDDLKERITLLRKGEYDKIKLPAFIPSGTSGINPGDPIGVRTDTVMFDKGTASNIICLDIDYSKDLYALKMDCRDIPSCLGYFESPSGKGLKVFLVVSTFGQNVEQFKSVWQQVVKYFQERTKNIVDLKCKNISRICYYSHDPYLYINSFPIAYQVNPEQPAYSEKPKIKYPQTIAINSIENFLIQQAERKFGPYSKGNRNNFIYVLACNANRYGVNFETTKQICEQIYNADPGGFSEIEFMRTLQSAYSHTNEHGKLQFIAKCLFTHQRA